MICGRTIVKLRWSDFELAPDQGYYIRICTEKTETEATLPISHEALELCGEWGKGLVFKGLTCAMTHHPLKQWIADAGIKKKITFHCLRHTFASTVTLANNVSLIVVSKMLGHSNVRMTEHYAKLVDNCIAEEMDKLMGNYSEE